MPSTTYGWCSTPSHTRFDHDRRDNCTDFVSDAEHQARLDVEAAEHDRHVTYDQAAAYVAEHRPY